VVSVSQVYGLSTPHSTTPTISAWTTAPSGSPCSCRRTSSSSPRRRSGSSAASARTSSAPRRRGGSSTTRRSSGSRSSRNWCQTGRRNSSRPAGAVATESNFGRSGACPGSHHLKSPYRAGC